MDPMPLAGQFCSDSQEALEAHCLPLSWVLCHQCGLVQVVEDVDESTLFRRYNYASSTVSGLVKHFGICRSWRLLGNIPVVFWRLDAMMVSS